MENKEQRKQETGIGRKEINVTQREERRKEYGVGIRQDKEIGPLFKASEAFMNMFWLLEEAFLHSLPNKITTMLSSLYAY